MGKSYRNPGFGAVFHQLPMPGMLHPVPGAVNPRNLRFSCYLRDNLYTYGIIYLIYIYIYIYIERERIIYIYIQRERERVCVCVYDNIWIDRKTELYMVLNVMRLRYTGVLSLKHGGYNKLAGMRYIKQPKLTATAVPRFGSSITSFFWASYS